MSGHLPPLRDSAAADIESDSTDYAGDDTTDALVGFEEAEYIRNYIDLQRLRLNEHTHITFTYNNRRTNAQVAPMLLITFVGNALKYGSSQSRASDINISLTVDDEGLRLLVSNPIHAGSVRQSSGTGIQNCRNRLELIYPHRYVLDIVEQNEHFTVNLFIKI